MTAFMLRALVVACGLLLCTPARAETHTYVVAIGNNAAPNDTLGERLEPLHYADDDAADFFELTRELSQAAFLLTVLDSASQRRFPDLTEIARPPTMHELRRAIATLRQLFDADLRAGHDSVLLFFFSGDAPGSARWCGCTGCWLMVVRRGRRGCGWQGACQHRAGKAVQRR